MVADDIPGVLAVQQDAYSEHFHEPATVIIDRLNSHPHTAWVAEMETVICAYLVAYHSCLGKVNPLHAPFASSDHVDCLYLHDLAIHSCAQGVGLARRLVSVAQDYAASISLAALALTAVQGSQTFWEKLGFRIYENLDAQQKLHLQTYVQQDEVAIYLIKRI